MLRSAKVKVTAGTAASSDSASEHSPPGVVRSDPFPSPPALVTPVPEAHASAEPIFETTLAEGVSLEHLEAQICSLAGRLASSTCDWLRLIAEFDRRKGWVQWGVRVLCALAGMGMFGRARCRPGVRAGGERRWRGLPLLDAAFREGRLSYSKVRALTRVAGRVPEQVLLRAGPGRTPHLSWNGGPGVPQGRRDAAGAAAEAAGEMVLRRRGMLMLTAGCPRMRARSWSRRLEQARHQAIVATTRQLTRAKAPDPVVFT